MGISSSLRTEPIEMINTVKTARSPTKPNPRMGSGETISDKRTIK